ncbi:hypothetical protein GCM10010862_53110 [Devosia nitrariae]|uniref:YjiS-like domain-containing protein n=2 Tax=Devosia nitrariae TaxID=2071872 RepID=A0ABQ5WD50_9HYPH|nr:hypothetical protein GCM10010862_53110 [Devosia nitrariae]
MQAVDAPILLMEINMFNVLDTWREKRAIRKTHEQLYQLSDAMLTDIGLTRADIPSVGLNGRVRYDRNGR